MRWRESNKTNRGGGGKAGVTKKDKGGQGAKTDTKLFLREAPVQLSKISSHSDPVYILNQAIITQAWYLCYSLG